MRLVGTLFTALLVSASAVEAWTTTFTRVKQERNDSPSLTRRSPQTDSDINAPDSGGESNKFNITSVHDVIYYANITVGGHEYAVQLDTGSSDLFLRGETHPIPDTEQTDLFYNLTFTLGWAYGRIAFAPVEFVGLEVPDQAFVDAVDASNSALGNGGNGIVGLGFTSLSHVDATLNRTKSARGRSLLHNIFHLNPDEPNFISFALHRTLEDAGEDEGSFAIGEIETEYSGVLGNDRIPTWPTRNPQRWNLLLDALIVNDTITPGTTKVVGAPENRAVALIDTGASWTSVPPEIAEAIYGDIPGATLEDGEWVVPCDVEINMALQFGGQVFPVHPLDVVMRRSRGQRDCKGTFVPAYTDPSWGFDWLVGDNFLRSVYSLYDFGDFDVNMKMGDPYMKMLSLVEPDAASIEFHNIRGGEPRTGIKLVGLEGVQIAPSFAISTDISNSLETLGKLLPYIFALVGANLLILLVAGIVWIVSLIKKRKRRAITRMPRARGGTRPGTALSRPNSYIAGMPDGGFGPTAMPQAYEPPIAYEAGRSNEPHTYDPVSMAFSDATFVPPSPAFHSDFKGERPKSVA